MENEKAINGIAGVIIWTDNLDRLLSFYQGQLGLKPHSIHSDFVAFSFGEVRLSIGLHSEISGTSKEPQRVMVNLDTKDIYKSHSDLLTRGVEFVRPPQLEHWGGLVATFRDPDGNLLQLLQQPEGK